MKVCQRNTQLSPGKEPLQLFKAPAERCLQGLPCFPLETVENLLLSLPQQEGQSIGLTNNFTAVDVKRRAT